MKKNRSNRLEIGVCDDKGEINLKVRIKVDWKLQRYWIKKIEINHEEE